jgi:hypothetical protein
MTADRPSSWWAEVSTTARRTGGSFWSWRCSSPCAREFVELLGPTHPHGRRGDGLEVFMRFAGSSDEDMGGEELTMWPDLEAIEHTLAYDAACMGDYRPPTPASEQVADRDRAEHPPGGAHDPCRPVTRGRPDRGRTSA